MANLTQLRMLEDLNGFLLVDKPAGIAFSSVVKSVKRKFNLVKVGHGGSLDAAASGLLVLLINDANKFVGDVMGADREYEGTIRLGLTTNTHDVFGEKLSEHAVDAVTDDSLARAVSEFRGDIFQTEPRFCAVRREGSAAYEVADTGDHGPFMTHVYRFDVQRGKSAAELDFSVSATKGLLVRTLANDFGQALGTGASLDRCRRVRVGKFKVGDAVPFDRILDTDIREFPSLVLPLAKALA